MAIVLSVGYALSKSKYAKPQPKSYSKSVGIKKARGVRWVCDRCGNDWIVHEPVPKDYKSRDRNTTADGKNLSDDTGRPWVCSNCGTYTLTNPEK